ncbi:Ecp8 [Fulvia fulva]|uniref:Ecp8 n=1 Tax=Passalora fulva TaxID=5499 RepID=A0A1P8YXI0_PASFU|nr:Ecp8 [Fulvia fulva]AQA29209.1 extracellular protein 8 [Fulvia fulva]KAK4618319.1 Ecp8 [Fulvia fulva]KAK4619120.1 Ecp8 [Fulvia fulva]UJO21193.1 Ecp8 [Fulvia fulva]WPV17858.1 Ecp8 [Fulvia fulva]
MHLAQASWVILLPLLGQITMISALSCDYGNSDPFPNSIPGHPQCTKNVLDPMTGRVYDFNQYCCTNVSPPPPGSVERGGCGSVAVRCKLGIAGDYYGRPACCPDP